MVSQLFWAAQPLGISRTLSTRTQHVQLSLIPTIMIDALLCIPHYTPQRCNSIMSTNFATFHFQQKRNLPSLKLAQMSGVPEKGVRKGKPSANPYVQISDMPSESWKLSPIIDILKQGGLGIVPTDTCYMFVTSVHSRSGVERIYALKTKEPKLKKPLSLLCSSISQISHYTTALNSKRLFKMLKELLPGPYTFIFPATNELPRMILEHKGHLKIWKRKEIGVRIPDNDVCLHIIEQLQVPLLCASAVYDDAGDVRINDPARLEEAFRGRIDFVVDSGEAALERPSSVIDLTNPDEPLILRVGAGPVDMFEEA